MNIPAHSSPANGQYSNAVAAGRIGGCRYEVLRKLGEGGMGAVYLTRMTGLGKQVALKVFASLGDSNLRRRFEREAALALEISYPGDGAFWRRMYCGLLLICDATPEARQTLGVKLPGSGQCLSLSPWQGSATLKRWSLAFGGASAVVCRHRLLRLERVFDRVKVFPPHSVFNTVD